MNSEPETTRLKQTGLGPRRSVVHGPLVALLAVLALVLSSCAGSAGGAGQPANQVLRWGWTLPTTWDSATAIGYDVHVLSLVYSGLTKLSVEGDVEPDLAESWTYNDAGDAVTFVLREGQTFSDGEPVNAEAVKTSLERGQDLSGSTVAQSLTAVEEITADSELEVTLHLTEVNYQIPNLLAGLVGHIVSPALIESGENIDLNPVGSGPFILEDYVPDSHADLVRNPDYWNADEIKIDNLQVLPRPEDSVSVAGVQSGQYTIAHIENSQVQAAEDAGLRVDINDIYNVYTLQINSNFEPWDDERVKEALSYAIDREELVETSLFGLGTPEFQPFNKGNVAYSPDLENLHPHSVDKAKELLAEAGYEDGVESTLYIPADDPARQSIAEAVQSQVAKAGIDLRLEIAPAGGGIFQAHDYPLNLSSYSGRESPVQGLEVLYSASGAGGWMNISQKESPNLQPALEAARQIPTDDPDYPEVLQKATEIAVTEDTPHAFLVNWVRAFAISPDIEGFDPYVHTQRFEGVEFRDND